MFIKAVKEELALAPLVKRIEALERRISFLETKDMPMRMGGFGAADNQPLTGFASFCDEEF